MKKPQYTAIIVSALALVLLLAFGRTVPRSKPHSGQDGHDHAAPASGDALLTSSFSIDSSIIASKKTLATSQISRISQLEKSLETASPSLKPELYHQLSHFWRDTGKAFIPYAWYTAESARLENSEKNLTFAGHLFLDRLQSAEDNEMRKWMALQAKDLFERSLTLNPDNDSSKVALGATYIFGGISNAPMQGIAKIREVAERDSTNVYAQMTLAMGSLLSGQTGKAQERLEAVNRIQPDNAEAILLLADIFEKKGDKTGAIEWYSKAIPLTGKRKDIRAELEKRIATLKK